MTTVDKSNASTTFVELAGLVECDTTRVIRLTDVAITRDEDDAFRLSRFLRGHPSLEEVILANITVPDGSFNMDAIIEMMLVSSQNLRVIKLDNVPVRAKSVSTLVYCETLETLALPNNGFNDVDAKQIADAVENSNSVTNMDLSGNKISDVGCKSLGLCLEKNKIIQEIKLSGNSVSGAESTKLESKLKARAAIAA
eukprot:scaffold4833_cov233-Amphora_coffeaeformis.AAC.5